MVLERTRNICLVIFLVAYITGLYCWQCEIDYIVYLFNILRRRKHFFKQVRCIMTFNEQGLTFSLLSVTIYP